MKKEKPIVIRIIETEKEKDVPIKDKKKHRFELMQKVIETSSIEENQYSEQPSYRNTYSTMDNYYPYPQTINSENYSQNQYEYSYEAPTNNILDIINNINGSLNNGFFENAPKRRGRPKKNPSSMNGVAQTDKPADIKNREEFYEVRFDDTLQALNELANDVDQFIDESKELFVELKNARKASAVAVTSQNSNINSLFMTKLNVLKEVNNTKKIVSDLEIKKQKGISADEKESDARTLDKLFTKISGVKNSPIPTSTILSNLDQAQQYQPIPNMPIGPNNIPPYETYVDSYIDDRISQLETDGTIPYNKSDISIRYENMQPTKVIIRNGKNYRLEVMDINGKIIPGYPLPPIEELGKIRFQPDGTALDIYGEIYQVIDI